MPNLNLRGKLAYRPLVFDLLPGEFTLFRLQRVVEALSGQRLHKQNFRRTLAANALVEPTGCMQSEGRGRPAELFRFRRAVLRAKPRSILVKLGISLGLGLAYLGFIRLYQWDEKSELAPFLALYALSGVIGGVVCTNALSWDATRVREALTSGRRLWHVMLSKNLTMFVLVGAVGVVLSVLLAWRTGAYGTSLVKALGQLVTMMLLWLGVGNVLSVVSPLRVEPLKARFKDGTLKPFLLSFVVSYVLGLGVNLMLTWRVWAKQSMIDELGGVTLPVLTLVLSGLLLYLLLTVLAVNLADQPRFRRALLREMVDYKALKSTAPAASGLAGA